MYLFSNLLKRGFYKRSPKVCFLSPLHVSKSIEMPTTVISHWNSIDFMLYWNKYFKYETQKIDVPAIIRYRTFCLAGCYLKLQTLRYKELQFCLLFCMGVKFGHSHWGRNVGCGCFRTGRVLRRILGPKKGKVIGEWRKLHNDELNDLYSSPIIVRVIKSSRMR